MIIRCNICNSIKYDLIYDLNKFKLFKCNKCQIYFVYPHLSSHNKIIINKSKYNSILNENTYFNKKQELINRTKNCIKLLSKYTSGGRLLDIGCSYGFILKQFQENGFESEGIEQSNRPVQYAKLSLKLNVYQGDFLNHRYKKSSYDIITLFDTLEHFSDPKKVVQKIRNIITKNGIIIIQTPNFNSIMSKITKMNWFWLLIPQHLHLFSISSLKYILENNGFKILDYFTWDDYDEMIKNILYHIKLKDKGLTSPLFFVLYSIFRLISIFGSLWNKYYFGGEITIYAKKT